MGRSAYDISIRETLQNRAAGLVIAAILFAAAITIGAHYLWPNKWSRINPYEVFYSDDDGQTYFEDSIYKLAPFDHNGKIANIAIVYTDGQRNYVGYLERYTPQARKQLQDFYDSHPDTPYETINLMASPQISLNGMELKMPGKDQPWLPRSRSVPQRPDMPLPGGVSVQIVRP